MNDQSVKADAGKIQPTLVPRELIEDVAEVREYGVKKYGKRDNWKDVEIQRYRDAAYRHWLAYVEDPDSIDEESGIPHYKHWACNCAFICHMERKRRANRKCRTCRYHEYEPIDRGYVCVNGDSEECTEWTEDDHSCEHWEAEPTPPTGGSGQSDD